jgi:hypothetical protein
MIESKTCDMCELNANRVQLESANGNCIFQLAMLIATVNKIARMHNTNPVYVVEAFIMTLFGVGGGLASLTAAFVTRSPSAGGSRLAEWHVDNQENFPTLHQIVLDTLSIPTMSTECERVFSSAKKLINPMRSLPKTDNIEASECLKVWWDCGMIT